MHDRLLWMAIFVIASVLVGCAAGLLSWLAGSRLATAFIAGGGGFSAAMMLLVLTAQFVTG